MLRWIDPDPPQELTDEQSRPVNQHPAVRELVGQRAALRLAGVGPSDPENKKDLVQRRPFQNPIRELGELQQIWY